MVNLLQSSKRQQIIQGAISVFLEQGYEGTSMDRIAAVAGVSKNTIYNHFQDKKGLFVFLMEQVTTERFERVFGSVSLSGDPAMVLRQIADKLLNTIRTDQDYIAFIRLIIGESGRFPELAQLLVKALPEKVIQTLTNYLDSHPELNLENTEATVRIFIGSLMGYILTQEVLHGKEIIPLEQEVLINSLVKLIIG
ncbi:transcriptional regulator, TetR family [Halothece sp. PCC 7418]|uniref:TetR/AcrR family transcriptional regulator n=1 Tax=Halothece sp. (strain PCC 7418) TaxID=65093 RepID=UPI0002A06BBB|nr:TetR/AcrR family transcriptional regulator [Halothece sp. PCC 7418]AFZ45764.1 transcriptional regulator, TetR family [Halothece sp. PCC 7418]